MTRRLASALAGAFLLALAPQTAVALPGDAPFDPLTPADGASMTVDADGIPVTFTCPVYRISDAGGGFVQFGGSADYGVSFSRSRALGPDGRLADVVALGGGREIPPSGSAQCESAMDAGGSQRPQETPGTYYWQVWRICVGCPLGYESGPVRALTLRANGRAALRLPARVFAGYPFVLGVSLPGVNDGSPVRIERRSGRGWKRVAADSALGEKAEIVLGLRRGSYTLRAVAKVGDQTVVSPARTLRVRPAARWVTGPGDDGAYSGKAGSRSVKFHVAGRGRLIKRFSAFVPMLCPGLVPGQFTTQIGTAAISTIKVAPDGGFVGTSTPGRSTSIRVRGRLRHGRVTGGRVELSVRTCVGSSRFGAKRAG